ncbi:MAG TPA: hypothetical protein VNT53_07425 [Pseudolysinimonas sp.]|nr:hypothetical protein [Pseudolysinimonas sp.]
MLKKILAGAIATALSLGVVALVASPASAHHNTIAVDVSCATSGAYTVSWTVTNSESTKSEVITESSLPDVVPVGTTLGFSESRVFTQHLTEPKDLTLALTGYWAAGNVTTKASASIATAYFPTGCFHVTPQLSKKQAACTGPNTYSDPSYTLVANAGVLWYINGALTPAGTYTATIGQPITAEAKPSSSKYTLDGTTVWTNFVFQEPSDAPCMVVVDPVTPEFTQQICSGGGYDTPASFQIFATTGVIYTAKFDGVEDSTPLEAGVYPVPAGVKTVQIIARGDTDNFYEIAGGSKVFDLWTVNGGYCLTQVTPVTPEVTEPVCVETKPGQVQPSTYTLSYVPHVIYLVSTDNVTFSPRPITENTTFIVQPGDHIWVRATVDDPSKYETPAFTWDHLFGDPGDCKVVVTPVKPEVTQEYCYDQDPTSPQTVKGTITIPTTTGVSYFIDGDEAEAGTHDAEAGEHIVTVQLADGYKLDPSVTLPFTLKIHPDPCLPTQPLVVPTVVSSQIGCFSAGSYTLSNDSASAGAVIWTVDGTQLAQGRYAVDKTSTVTVTAAPRSPDYGFAEDTQTSWTINFVKPTACDLETLAFTGGSPAGLIIAADLLLVAGLAAFAIRALRRRPQAA